MTERFITSTLNRRDAAKEVTLRPPSFAEFPGQERVKEQLELFVQAAKARDEALEVLQSVVDNDEAVEATKEQAISEISKIADDIRMESNIETLIMSKGFEQCVAVINGDLVNIIVKSDGLLANEVAQINEIVYEQTGAVPSNVKIIEKKS